MRFFLTLIVYAGAVIDSLHNAEEKLLRSRGRQFFSLLRSHRLLLSAACPSGTIFDIASLIIKLRI